MPDPMFELSWICMRDAGHGGDCLTAGCPMGINPENRCGKPGARFIAPEEKETAPADLYIWKSGDKYDLEWDRRIREHLARNGVRDAP